MLHVEATHLNSDSLANSDARLLLLLEPWGFGSQPFLSFLSFHFLLHPGSLLTRQVEGVLLGARLLVVLFRHGWMLHLTGITRERAPYLRRNIDAPSFITDVRQ